VVARVVCLVTRALLQLSAPNLSVLAYKNEHPHFDGLRLCDFVVQFDLIIVWVRFSLRCDIKWERKRNGEREVSLQDAISSLMKT